MPGRFVPRVPTGHPRPPAGEPAPAGPPPPDTAGHQPAGATWPATPRTDGRLPAQSARYPGDARSGPGNARWPGGPDEASADERRWHEPRPRFAGLVDPPAGEPAGRSQVRRPEPHQGRPWAAGAATHPQADAHQPHADTYRPQPDAHQPHADTYRPQPDAYRPVGHGPWPGPVESQPPGDVVTAVPVAEPHRTGTRLPGPIGLAALVAALLVTFGVGAFLLSPTLANPRDTAGAQLPNGVGAPAPADPSTAAASPPPTAPVAGIGPASPLAAAPTSAAPTSAAAAAPATSAPAVERAKPSPTKARSATVAREDQVTTLVNKARVAAGCRAVRTDERLRTAARGHSKDMARRNYFAHDSLDGRSPWDRAKAAGYAQPIGENIAKGQRTPTDVMQAWLNSPGHRRNILNCDARATGVGLVYDGSTPIWTQMFGSR